MSAHSPILMHRTLLLVDEVDDRRVMTRLFLGHFGYSVETARTAEEALRLFNPRVHDLVVTGNQMPGLSGSEMAHIVKLRSPSTPVLMITDLPPKDRSCLDDVLQRPAHLLQLRQKIQHLLAESPTAATAR